MPVKALVLALPRRACFAGRGWYRRTGPSIHIVRYGLQSTGARVITFAGHDCMGWAGKVLYSPYDE